jgi:hypothetical protein
MPRLAIRAAIPRRRSQARLLALSWPCPHPTCRAGDAAGPTVCASAGRHPTTASMVTSATLAAVIAAVSGSPPPSQTRCSLDPGLPRSTGFAPTWSPHVWRARWPNPGWHAASPAGLVGQAGPVFPGATARTRRPWPTGPGAARRSRASRSQARVLAGAAMGWRRRPRTRSRRSSCDPGWCALGRPTRAGVRVAGGAATTSGVAGTS